MRLNNFINRKGHEDFRKERKGNTNGKVVSAFYRLWDDRWYVELLAVRGAEPLIILFYRHCVLDPQSLVNTVKTHNYVSLQNEIAEQARNDGKIDSILFKTPPNF